MIFDGFSGGPDVVGEGAGVPGYRVVGQDGGCQGADGGRGCGDQECQMAGGGEDPMAGQGGAR